MFPIFATWTKNVYVSYLEKNNKEEEVEQAENWTCFRTDDETVDALGQFHQIWDIYREFTENIWRKGSNMP